jgi:ligand-binding SRPBCC domain-containing protein
MTASFECSTVVVSAIDTVFDVSLNIDAHLRSMEASKEIAVGGITSGQIGIGEQVTWRARHFGRWWSMTSCITSLERPRMFVDEQVRGPFARFRHEHTFHDEGETTRMVDRVTFSAPLGPLGTIAERMFLAKYIRSLIEDRNRYLKDTAEASSSTARRQPEPPPMHGSP